MASGAIAPWQDCRRRERGKAGQHYRSGVLAIAVTELPVGKRPSCPAEARDTIKTTVGFEQLGAATDTPPKTLIRMFGPRGNPQAKNLFNLVGYLQKRAGVQLHVSG
jgi:hypothetical protein